MLTPEQQKTLKKAEAIAKLLELGDLAVIEELISLKEYIDENKGELVNIKAEVFTVIETAKNLKDGKDGQGGRDGVDGKDGRNGVDGRNGRDGRDGMDGQNGKDGQDGQDGKDGRDGSPDSPLQIATKINSLFDAIDPRAIKGWSEIQRIIENNSKLPNNFDVRIGVSKTEMKRLTDRVTELETGSSGFNVETPTGTVDGSNTSFDVENTPKAILIDGLIKVAGFGYTFSAPTITVDSDAPPVQFIRSLY